MPRQDLHHTSVRRALEREGWTITHDPLVVPAGLTNVFVDLGAERLIGAERGGERIAVEIKSFVGHSHVADVEQAVGQYLVYRSLLRRHEPDRELHLAVPVDAFEGVLSTQLGLAVREDYAVTLIVYDAQAEVIRRWQK